MSVISSRAPAVITIPRWPTELPLTALVTVVALGLWALCLLSVVGAVYAVGFGAFFFVAHAAAVAHIRGSAVRLGPDQFPDLHRRVEELATAFGMERAPDAYLMQAGGVLNAFATRFLFSDILVLHSELLEACGENTAARDMIIGHELGHLHAGHLRLFWLRAPGHLFPFLGSALSRAREYTCDRYGVAGAGDRDGALLGLTVLASGGRRAALVNRQRFVRQQEDLNTGWMRIGEWMGSHPPLSRRLAALEPALAVGVAPSTSGTVRGLAIIAVSVLVVVAGSVAGLRAWTGLRRAIEDSQAPAELQGSGRSDTSPGLDARVREDLRAIAGLAVEIRARDGAWPATEEVLYAAWARAHPSDALAPDMYGGGRYAYRVTAEGIALRSVGPDGVAGTPDDISFEVRPDASQGSGFTTQPH